MEPLVSVDCITYNHAPFIRAALNGFIMQNTNFPFEVLIHDDASTDGTQDILRDYERDYPDIFKVIYQKENQYSKGVNIAKIYQLSRAKGKYIASCEGDDYWFHPSKLQMQVDYMEEHENCSCSFHPAVWLRGSMGNHIHGVNQPWSFETDIDPEKLILPEVMGVDTCSAVYRTSIAKEWPKFRLVADIGDNPLIFLLLMHGYFHYFPNIMGAYRFVRQGSWTEKMSKDREFAIKHHIVAFKWLYEFNLYSEGKFVVPIGKKMWYNVERLDMYNALKDFPKFAAILVEAVEKIKPMAGCKEIENDKSKDEDVKYWTWFVETIGKEAEQLP